VVISDVDLQHLRRCSELAGIALKAGHGPFGAMLVGADGQALYEDHNRVTDHDRTFS
jgi:tRNA(Arg) A34 adenosine deaminase TadA